MFKLPTLPYAKFALAPFLSEEQMSYHYDKHHKAYIDKLNGFMETDTSLRNKSLEDIMLSSQGGVFNNAAQAWNHSFFWFGMAPAGQGGKASAKLEAAIQSEFGGMEPLKKKFIEGGVGTFGSGWIWLCSDKSGKLSLQSTSNAQTPATQDLIPLLTADVWEHAYYVDYRNLRPKFLETFWTHINWKFVSENFESAKLRTFTKEMQG